MHKPRSLSESKQILLQSVSDAVTEQVIADVRGLRADNGAGLSELLDDAILQAIDHTLGVVAQAVLGVSNCILSHGAGVLTRRLHFSP